MLTQRLQQKLLQKLSPQQIQLMKLLQIPTVALEQRIKQEIEENPALEESTDDNSEFEERYDDADNEYDTDEQEPTDDRQDDFDINDYLQDDETPSYKLTANNKGRDDEDHQVPYAAGTTFHELLYNQLGLQRLDEREYTIASTIIGNLDDSGYLERSLDAMIDDLMFTFNIEATTEELEALLSVIQSFDPPGVGARSLQECLLIQLNRVEEDTKEISLAKTIIRRFFNEFTKKHYEKIIKRADITEDELRAAISEILKLNPKPGNSMGETSKVSQYIIPDFIINNNDGELDMKVNARNTPELKVSNVYKEMLTTYSESKKGSAEKDAVLFVKQKIDSAKWFIEAIKQRQNTLYVTMKAIMDYQHEYFLTGDETKLKPMILKDIAEVVNLDISTISRVASSKYVMTPFGTFLLKSFFSESLQTDSGEEVSSREVKKILEDCITKEDKKRPLTDEKLAKILKEKGYSIARRTVAKYREQSGIPVARLRKEL